MYDNAYGWPRQSWRLDPAPIANRQHRPYDSQPVVFQRRDLLGNGTWSEEDSDPAGVCHADLRSLGNGNQDAYLDLDYDERNFGSYGVRIMSFDGMTGSWLGWRHRRKWKGRD
jgi:hypothetical protein